MKRQAMLEAVQDLKQKRDRCGLHSMTFSPCPKEAKEAMEKDQHERFLLWWDTWILPKLEFLERELTTTTKKG